MGLYTTLARPLLFRLRPELAQAIGDALLRATPLWRPIRPFLATTDPRLKAQVAGLRLPNPLGAAAGIDKNCRMLPGLLSTGFGFAVGGTVTLTPRPGNVRPRLLRDTGRRALVNAMGFPGDGLDAAEARLRRLGDRAGGVWVSVSGTDDDDIAECHRRLQPLAAAVEVNVSSPNTAGLRVFHAPARLRRLLDRLVGQKDRPLFVKLPPWASEGDRDAVLPMAETAAAAGVDGLVIANTHPVEDGRLAVGRGGLSDQRACPGGG
ncbi:MAG: dihydroorotate dehydrogenase (quinone) [Dehalococcoidia bacterium]